MTAVAAILTRQATVHATDSLVTKPAGDGLSRELEGQASKTVPLPALRGAVSFWGRAWLGTTTTQRWLANWASTLPDGTEPEAAAGRLREALDAELDADADSTEQERGIGLHLTAYEKVRDLWVPELFQLTNYEDPTYRVVLPRIRLTRETAHTLLDLPKDEADGSEAQRLAVYERLGERVPIYNNGSTVAYNTASRALWQMMDWLAHQGRLDIGNLERSLHGIARMPIEWVAAAEEALAGPGRSCVGGTVHSLLIRADGSTDAQAVASTRRLRGDLKRRTFLAKLAPAELLDRWRAMLERTRRSIEILHRDREDYALWWDAWSTSPTVKGCAPDAMDFITRSYHCKSTIDVRRIVDEANDALSLGALLLELELMHEVAVEVFGERVPTVTELAEMRRELEAATGAIEQFATAAYAHDLERRGPGPSEEQLDAAIGTIDHQVTRADWIVTGVGWATAKVQRQYDTTQAFTVAWQPGWKRGE